MLKNILLLMKEIICKWRPSCLIIYRHSLGSIRESSRMKVFVIFDALSDIHTTVTRPWYVLSCLWDDSYERTLAANRKE